MKAVVCDRYGPPEVLRFDDVERPVPGPDQVLIKIHATTVNRSDTEIRQGSPALARLVTGLHRPRHRILGSELAGVIEAAGPAVTEFSAGDAVFGVKAWTFGAHAEYLCMPESAALAHKPSGVGFEEAAAVCDGVILALMGLRPAEVRKGAEHPRLRRLGVHRHRGGPAVPVLRRRRHRGVRH
jgi:NADPH:quinone reductase-like Zn-dependent oxidoreductase